MFAPSPEVEAIRREIDHPIIDGDGHLLEFEPLVVELLREFAEPAVVERFLARDPSRRRGSGGSRARTFWGMAAENALDRVTATLPRLQYERAGELGLDFMLLYPTLGLSALSDSDAELRRALTRALNHYYAEVYHDYRDRLEPVAVIPLVDPGEAVAALDEAVGTLGLKAIVCGGVVERATYPDGSPGPWLDTVGFGSVEDYDPFWERCAQLGVAPTFHGVGIGWGTRVSPANYVYNHIGNFATTQEAVSRSLVMGGVPQRFPSLRFAFLEGGVSWACQLYADVLGHFDKRNKDAVQIYDPRRMDLDRFGQLFDEFATGRLRDGRGRWFDQLDALKSGPPLAESEYDDFAESRIETPEDVVDIFTQQFFFGCEADDPMNALAYQTALLPHGARLNAVFASDVGHWDVPDMREVLPEAWELVDDGHITRENFCDFTCGSIVRMLTAANPAFFEDTAVAEEVRPYAAVQPAT